MKEVSEPAAGALPAEPRMRYWRPAAEFTGLVSGYHLYAVRPEAGKRHQDVFQPAWPILRFTFGEAGGWRVRPPRGGWQPVPPIALFGPTSGITWSRSGPGTTIGIGLLPGGWARLSARKASDWSNRVDRPDGTLRGDLHAVYWSLACATRDDEVPSILDAFLGGALGHAGRADGHVAAFEKALLDPLCRSVAELADRVGLSVRSLERLAGKAFGFPPKLLIRRARFLRSLHAVAAATARDRASAIDPGYADYSHFVRDSHEFLRMSPQAFLKLDNPLLKQSLALRKEVLGAPAQALAR